MKKVFQKMDKNHDNLIDIEEFTKFFIHLKLDIDREEIETLFNRIDQN